MGEIEDREIILKGVILRVCRGRSLVGVGVW